MTEDFKEVLDSEFPFMAEVGLECGEGWYPLIRELCREITAAYEAAGKPADIVVSQVKEKYGELCFYFDCRCQGLRTEIEKIVEKYEEMSGCVCEVCGAPGSLRTDLQWIQTLCDEHYREKENCL